MTLTIPEVLPITPVRHIEIGEPIPVYLALIDTADDVRALLDQLPMAARENVHLVVHAFAPLGRGDVPALRSLARRARMVVVTPGRAEPRGELPSWLPTLRGASMPAVQVEPEVSRAVIGTMQSLQIGHSLVVLWPRQKASQAVDLIRQGALWRASLEQPEDGVFHHLPPT